MTQEVERPKLLVLEFVSLPEVSPSLGLLEDIAAANWVEDDCTPESLLAEIRQGRIWMWHIKGVERGLALLRIEETPKTRTLVLYGLAGHNVLTRGQAIGQDLQTIAKFYGCAEIDTVAHDLRWNFVAKRLGFDVAYVVYRQKVN